jgi:hypothetical protein
VLGAWGLEFVTAVSFNRPYLFSAPHAMLLCMIVLTLTWIGIACWMVCFWWMHRISSRQETMLKELHEMTTRIEQLSQAEHDLISEVHPQVSEIKEHVEDVAQKVTEDSNQKRGAQHRAP